MKAYNKPSTAFDPVNLVLCALGTILIICGLLMLLPGCASANPLGLLTKPTVRTNEIVRYVTNAVEVPVFQPPLVVTVTNTVTLPGSPVPVPVVVTNFVERPPLIFTNYIAVPVTNFALATNFAINPSLENGISVAQTLNALNPTPTAPAINLGLMALAGFAGIVARWQNRKANQAQAAAELSDDLAKTVILGVESYNGPGGDKIKQAIARVSEIREVKAELHSRVKAVTEAMADGRMDANELHALASDPSVAVEDVPEIYRKAFSALREAIESTRGTKVAV
jgi:hypothetical protein